MKRLNLLTIATGIVWGYVWAAISFGDDQLQPNSELGNGWILQVQAVARFPK